MLTDLNQVYAERGAGGKIWLITINGTIHEQNQLFGRCGGMVTVEIWPVLHRVNFGVGCIAQTVAGFVLGLGREFLVPTGPGNFPEKPSMSEHTLGDSVGLRHPKLLRESFRRRIAKHQFAIRETT